MTKKATPADSTMNGAAAQAPATRVARRATHQPQAVTAQVAPDLAARPDQNGNSSPTEAHQVAVVIEDDRTGMSAAVLRRAYKDNLYYLLGKDEYTATPHDRYMALAYTVRDRLVQRWIRTTQAYKAQDLKRVNYLSAEFLMGRALASNLFSLGIMEETRQALDDLGVDLKSLYDQEPDAGLGNGGLGRLAACFLDSLATLGYPATGYGLRYEYGIFAQRIVNGEQVEQPDEWLRYGNPWEVPRPEYVQRVQFGGTVEAFQDEQGYIGYRWVGTDDVLGLPYDTPIPGFRNNTVNTLRLWSARAVQEFDFEEFDRGDYADAVHQKTVWENISKVLYPNDNSMQGKELRLKQQYFFVSCSVKDILRRYLQSHRSFDLLPDRAAIQMNDTHPSIAIAELMRLLLDEHGLAWEVAWRITVRCFGYTNHTLLAEALEKWPVEMFQRLLPRHLQILFEINRRFLEEVRQRFPGDESRAQRMSLFQDSPRMIRMAHLATIGSHSINGVAALHSQLLRTDVLRDFADMWPERFNNRTNGVTPRRFMALANPRLARLVTEALGDDHWITDLSRLRALEPLAEDARFRARFRRVKRENKALLADWIRAHNGLDVNLDSLFDVQVKRFHEYKRQHLNALHIVHLYNRIKRDPQARVVPRTFIFAGKSAPGYYLAKKIIHLINAIGSVVNQDPDVAGRLRVVFLENYSVTLAERIIPAADLSEQISTAGKEASGTGNMKFGLNGALTVGTLDGANVEIRELVGAENFFLFGLTAPEVAERRARGPSPMDAIHSNPDLREVLDRLSRNEFAPGQPDVFRPLLDNLVGSDPYFVLADFAAYVEAQERVSELYLDPEEWTRRSILNVARLGHFSSDRTIQEYCQEIWDLEPCPVSLPHYVQD